MSVSYINVKNNINIYYKQFILNYILPFKLCLFLLKIHGDLPPYSNGYVCENIFECIISGRSLGKFAERSITP